MNGTGDIGLGVIGCGGFGLFALQHFVQVPGVKPVAMAGTHRDASIAAAARFGIPDIEDVEQLLRRSDVELVYIATPPFLHYPQAMAALDAGKHVICEKPLAVTGDQADQMIATAQKNGLLLVANLMQRYNPLFDAVGRLIESRVLGELLHGYFENYAADEGLPPDHWFWNREKSGGIFIEHSVHFFDLMAGWLGPGCVVAAQRILRPGSGVEEQVQCTVRYRQSVLMNFYHGFHQPGRLDRQELRLLFERGDVTLLDWVPTRLRIHAIADEASTRAICELFPGARLDITQVYAPKDRNCQGRHKQLDAYQLLNLYMGDDVPKIHRYGELLRAVLGDQVAWIRDRSHRRRITEQNGRESLAMALTADAMAAQEATKNSACSSPPHRHLLIRPQDITPSHDALEVIGAFNPGAIEYNGDVVLLVRIAERPREHRAGFTALPRWEEQRVVTEWTANHEIQLLDPRVVRHEPDGLLRLTFTSHLRVVRSRDGRTIDRWDGAALVPHEDWEEYGIEDPRIVYLDGRYWITYVAVSRHGAATALASTDDFETFERHGIIFCPENKDVVLFPQKIGGQYVALHRPTTAHPFCRPEIWLARSADLLHWGKYQPLHGGTADWEADRVGGGAPPIRTEAGWLEIYHASRRSPQSGQVGTYTAGAMLLDLEDPSRVLARSRRPLWEPDADHEHSGFVPGIVFPSGTVVRDDTVQLYYGAADTFTAMAEFDISDLIGDRMLEF